MRLIVTGGTGLIGRALVASLASDGHEVIVLSRNPGRKFDFPSGVTVQGWDAKTTHGWGHLVEGIDAVVNLAGESLAGEGFFPRRWTAARRKRIRDSRLNAGEAIAQAVEAAAHKPEVIVQAAAIGYYGPRGDEALTEEDSPAQDFLAQLCVDWEHSTARVEEMGVRRAVIRSGLVLSMDGGAFPRMLLPYKLFAGGPFGHGRQVNSWIHMADEVAAIRFLIEYKEARGAFNLTAPSPVSNRAFGKTLGKVIRRPSYMPVPGFAMKLMFGEVSTVVLDGQRVLPKGLQGLGFTFQFPELEGALRDLLG